MKKVVFIVSHLGAGSRKLINIMNKNPRISIQQKGAGYFHASSLEWLFDLSHKTNDSSAIYGDHLLFDANFACKSLYNICGFIYLIRPAKPSLNQIVKNFGYTPENAFAYYTFRLRRICEMAKNTPGSPLLTWNDLATGRGFSTIEEYLHLKSPLEPRSGGFTDETQDELPVALCEKAQDSYEKHLYYLKRLNLKSI
jgi:hypothetical protein